MNLVIESGDRMRPLKFYIAISFLQHGGSALFGAIHHGLPDVVVTLLQRGAKFKSANDYQFTPLMAASAKVRPFHICHRIRPC